MATKFSYPELWALYARADDDLKESILEQIGMESDLKNMSAEAVWRVLDGAPPEIVAAVAEAEIAELFWGKLSHRERTWRYATAN